MKPFLDMQFGERIITLMAALVLVLQIAVVAQRWIVTHIRIFAIQSFLLAMIAATIAWFNHAPHIYIAAALTLVVKVILVPILFERLVVRMDIREEIKPIINVPLSVVISGGPQRTCRGHLSLPHRLLHHDQSPQGFDAGPCPAVLGERPLSRGYLAYLWNATDRRAWNSLRCAGGCHGARHPCLPHPRNL
jgi:hypothetical protein